MSWASARSRFGTQWAAAPRLCGTARAPRPMRGFCSATFHTRSIAAGHLPGGVNAELIAVFARADEQGGDRSPTLRVFGRFEFNISPTWLGLYRVKARRMSTSDGDRCSRLALVASSGIAALVDAGEFMRICCADQSAGA